MRLPQFKTLCLLFVLICTGIAGVAQETTTPAQPSETNYKKVDDVVRLNNGWIIRGKILYYQPGEKVRIQSTDGNEYVFYGDEILSVTQEPKAGKQKYPHRHGLYMQPSLQIGYGNNAWGLNGLNASGMLSSGFRFKNGFAAGAGTGLERIDYFVVVPVFAEGYYFLPTGQNKQPYLRGFGGYAIAASSENEWTQYDGGAKFGADVGVSGHINQSLDVLFAFGWHSTVTQVTYSDPWSGTSITETNTFNRLALRLGLLF